MVSVSSLGSVEEEPEELLLEEGEEPGVLAEDWLEGEAEEEVETEEGVPVEVELVSPQDTRMVKRDKAPRTDSNLYVRIVCSLCHCRGWSLPTANYQSLCYAMQ